MNDDEPDNKVQAMWKIHLKKLFRLYPVYITVIAIYWAITPSLHAGPVWFVYEEAAEQCNSSWWWTILMIDNWFSEGCYQFSWFVQV